MSMEECTRRASIELDHQGFFVVEEISEDDGDQPHQSTGMSSKVTSSKSSSPPQQSSSTLPSGPESPTPSLPFNPLRREFGNISPISEDFSDISDKELESIISRRHPKDIEDIDSDLDTTKTSTTAIAGDTSSHNNSSSLLLQRLNCSSPILAQSPSLRKTPILMAAVLEKEAQGQLGQSPSSSSSPGGKRLRNLARALDDISDRDEEDEESDHVVIMGSKDSDDDEETNDMMILDEDDPVCSTYFKRQPGQEEALDDEDDEEEKTESFEIDLNNSAERQCEDAAAGGYVSPFSLRTSESYVEFGAALANLDDDDEVKVQDHVNGGTSNGNGEQQLQQQQRTVWETLSDNIETHINGGNNAGFVSGPIDHPIHVTKSPEPTESIVMSLEELALNSRYDEEHKVVSPSSSFS